MKERISERISELISVLGLRKTAFARRLNISPSFVSDMCSGKSLPSDRTIADICREFNVNENWLRYEEGQMFVKKTRSEEIASFMGDILNNEEAEFARRLVAVLARLDTDEWKLLEKMAEDLVLEMKKADPEKDRLDRNEE